MTHSAKQFSESTGPRQRSTGTSASLLPTPRAADAKGGKYQRDRGKRGKERPTLTGRISSLEDSPANLSRSPDEEEERQTTATSGLLCLKPSLFSDRHGSSLRTLRDSLLGTTAWYSRQCALTWKTKVTRSSRLLFRLLPSARHTREIGSGLLPTKSATSYGSNRGGAAGRTGKVRPSVESLVAMLPTPRAADGEKGSRSAEGHAKERERRKNGVDLPTAVQHGPKNGLKLQPGFALWMMGFPADWCDLEDGEMPRSKRPETR